MSRETIIAAALDVLASGRFKADLARRVAMPTVSREAAHKADLQRYIDDELIPVFDRLGFATRIFRRDAAPGAFLLASRIEDAALPTVLMYGHGDVVTGVPEQWSEGLAPFTMTERDGRWYGRGTADNKGQHSVNLAALEAVLAHGPLGFNLKYLMEMGEEYGSPALAELIADEAEAFAADMLIASDGPRIGLAQPTIFLGARGGVNIHLEVVAREGYHHSGNWGGLLANPGVELSHAIAALIGPTGECLVPELTPGTIPDDVRAALARCTIETAPGDPDLDAWWGAPGLSQAERVYGWSTLEVMEIEVGNIAKPLYAIPPWAKARLQLRHPVGVDTDAILPAIRRKLDAAGFQRVQIVPATDASFPASRSDLDNEWVRFVAASIERTMGTPPVILPNLGGSLPNTIFTDTLGLPTIWVPHSYPGCGQHGADEHLPIAIVREGLAIMAGIFWDLGHR
ncbi:M20/M25/M40 family metallo-hydrolase [Falsirhodobacter xinxiangensis]|uniref:M20/M25/M40 family metallo-hydrolase n=1 Tax=Falsirhodobacter xinxiangensis TaxID=2530049 RepID=UPI0010A9B7A4|nr:M20/M25/M40 family metallo-hydrolase [Rhodobacter xinxiangensis]